ncbi:MAG: Hpt domain-containing protein [Magnetococcales bacterium]|nr:Hpt domain-containing protein [Magnetococcales bacterium]
MDTKDKLVVKVDKDLEDITPGYLENRRKDLAALPLALAENQFEAIKMIGHRMKGSGAGYGFQAISDLGTRIERAANSQDQDEIRACVTQLEDYLSRIEVEYQ